MLAISEQHPKTRNREYQARTRKTQ